MINAQSGMFILFILLLMFGAKKLPELARGLGQAIKEFSKAKNDIQDEIMREPVSEPARQIPPQTVQQPPIVQPAGTQPVAGTPMHAEQQPSTHA
jgi:TatA/E family protein of Tat protein translocase